MYFCDVGQEHRVPPSPIEPNNGANYNKYGPGPACHHGHNILIRRCGRCAGRSRVHRVWTIIRGARGESINYVHRPVIYKDVTRRENKRNCKYESEF